LGSKGVKNVAKTGTTFSSGHEILSVKSILMEDLGNSVGFAMGMESAKLILSRQVLYTGLTPDYWGVMNQVGEIGKVFHIIPEVVSEIESVSTMRTENNLKLMIFDLFSRVFRVPFVVEFLGKYKGRKAGFNFVH
jgi:hypothetical protein